MAEYRFLVGEHQGAAIELLQSTLNQIDEREQAIDPAAERAGHLKDTLRTERIAVLASLGELRLKQGDYAQALDCFLAADALVNHDGFVMPAERMGLNLARAYIGLAQYSDAISVLEVVRADGPAWMGADADQDDPQVVSLLAEAYLDDGNYEEAARCIEATAAAFWPVESEYWLRQRANLLRLQAELAISRDNDADRGNALFDEALACLVLASQLFPWDSAYRKDLTAEIHRVIDERLEQAAGVPLIRNWLWNSAGLPIWRTAPENSNSHRCRLSRTRRQRPWWITAPPPSIWSISATICTGHSAKSQRHRRGESTWTGLT